MLPLGLHKAIIGLENQFLFFLRVAVLHRFYCNDVKVKVKIFSNFFIMTSPIKGLNQNINKTEQLEVGKVNIVIIASGIFKEKVR